MTVYKFTCLYFYFMIFYLLFQIFISWFVASCILKLFYKTVSVKDIEVYREPALLTFLLTAIDINFPLRAKFITGKILHHCIGVCFASIYYLIWYYEFKEISWTISLIIGLINGLLHIIGWVFLLEIIPSSRLSNFKGYYLQLVFVHNVFTISAITIYELF